MFENGNYKIRQWKVTLYGDELFGKKRRILTVIGTFIDVCIKIKYIMDDENYTSMFIEEVDKWKK